MNFMYAHVLTNGFVNIPSPQIGETISVGSGSDSNHQLSDRIYLKWKNKGIQ